MTPRLQNLDTRAAWRYLASARDDDIPLLQAALLVARDEYPALDPHEIERQQEAHVALLRARIGDSAEPMQALRVLQGFLFDEQGYAGNEQDYYDPRNSYLNEVMARRTGNPIALAVLELDLAKRLDLGLQGVSFPGHFLVRMPVEDGLLVLDPFYKGRSLDARELKVRARPHVGDQRIDDEQLVRMLEPAPNRVILARLLRNLRQGYVEREDFERALRCADRIVALDERDGDEVRERGLLYARIGHTAAARADLTRYLQLATADAEDIDRIRQILVDAVAAPGSIN